MSAKPDLGKISEQAIGGIIGGLVVSIISGIINTLSGGVYSTAVPLLIGATALIVALLLGFLCRPFETFLRGIGAGAIAGCRWLIHNWQLVLGLILVSAVPVAIYGFTGTSWPAILTFGLEVAFILLARYEQTVLIFSGKGMGDFSYNRKDSGTPAVVCDPPYPHWIRLEGADWVWIKEHPTDQEAQEGQSVWHRIPVEMPRFLRKLHNATLYFVVDDFANVFVNEALVRRCEKGGAVIALDVGNYVHPGENLIEMEIENAAMEGATSDRNPAGITFILEMRLRLY